MALPPRKDKAPGTDYYPSVMSAIQRLTNPGSAEDRLKFYVRLRTASQLQFAVEAPDEDAARRNMEDLEAAISRVELELAKTRGTAPELGAPTAPPKPLPEPVKPAPPSQPERPKPTIAGSWPPKLAKPLVEPAPTPAPPPKPAAFVFEAPTEEDDEDTVAPPPAPAPPPPAARRPEPRGADTRIEPLATGAIEPRAFGRKAPATPAADPMSVAPAAMPQPARPREPRSAPIMPAREVAPPQPEVDDAPPPHAHGIPTGFHTIVAMLVLLLVAVGAGVAVWFLAAPTTPTASTEVTASITTAPAPAANTIPAGTPVAELRRVSPEALVGLRLMMPQQLRGEPWAYALNGDGGALGTATIEGKPAVTGSVCKPSDCEASHMSFAITLDGSRGALVVQSPAVNNGQPAFVGPQGSEGLALATSLFNAA